MIKKIINVVILLPFIFLSFSQVLISMEVSDNNIIYVDDDGNADYSSIKDAIDNASDGDLIFVYNGIYYENNIKIYKSLKIIGENYSETIIHGNGNSRGISLFSSNFYLNNITMENYGSNLFNSGFILGGTVDDPEYCENIFISNCIFQNNAYVQFYISCNNVIINNCKFINNKQGGIYAINVSNFKIINSTMENCGNPDSQWGSEGIFIGPVAYNISIEQCYFENIYNKCIVISSGLKINNVTIKDNVIEGLNFGYCIMGICLININYGIIQNNFILNISGDNIFDSGIFLQDCNLINLSYNGIKNNKCKSIFLVRSLDNTFKSNNFINNKIDVYFVDSDNFWYNNYWGRLRIFPKIIFGLKVDRLIIPNSFDIDWHPAKEPNKI